MNNSEKRRLGAWSAVMGSLSVAVSGVATMWLPSPWDGIAWAALAIILCTVCGLSYPVLPSTPTFWPPAGWDREPQSWGRRYEHGQIQAVGEFSRLQQPASPTADAISLVIHWPELSNGKEGGDSE